MGMRAKGMQKEGCLMMMTMMCSETCMKRELGARDSFSPHMHTHVHACTLLLSPSSAASSSGNRLMLDYVLRIKTHTVRE